MIHHHDPHRKELFSLLSTQVEMHHEIQITGHHGTRTVKILAVLEQMQAARDANHIFGKIKELHSITEAEKPLYVGHAIRHVVQQEEKLGTISKVQLLRQAPVAGGGALAVALPEDIDLTDQARLLAKMDDDEFKGFLDEFAHELTASLEGKPHQLKPEVSRKLGRDLAADFKKSKLPLLARHDDMRNNLIVKLAVRMAALAICENARAERRAEAEREEEKQIEKQELKRDILKREILEDDISRDEMMSAIIETLRGDLEEGKKASEEDLQAVARALVDLVWLGLPKAFI
jgi:hypothetical protein